MPSKGEKLLRRARASQANWKYRELVELYKSFGFELKTGKSGGHRVVWHPNYPTDLELMTTVTEHAEDLGKGYVRDAIRLIEALKRREQESQDDE